jgi:GDSL-like Lipase/Acylhydrolase family
VRDDAVDGGRATLRRVLIVCVVAAALLASSACDGLGNATVGIVGDSITNRSACTHETGPLDCTTGFTTNADGAIGATFANSYAVFLDAWSGKTIADMEPYVVQRADDGVHVLIIELGTNDATVGNLNWQNDYLRVLTEAASVSCVVLVTVPLEADIQYANAHGGARLNIAAQLNALMNYMVEANPNMRLVDYATHLSDTPGFSLDGIHPTSLAAQQWVADQYKLAADSC